LGKYTSALMVSQDRRHLFVTPSYARGGGGLRGVPANEYSCALEAQISIGKI
jgi:hypothetical protein